ncbi:MAG TPA: DUF1836 domain-containing protein [Clostridia bacterium]|nr:DUF1836 domain-containing protein [Clostridia bacterium]
MEELVQLKNMLLSERPVSWAEFPDIGLYKDQVVSYLQRQLIDFEGDGRITSAMINNYIKDKLLPRADGKKYSREHLAGLTEIGILKQVLSVRNTGFLLQKELDENKPEGFYDRFRGILDKELKETAGHIDQEWDMAALSEAALTLAVSSYCSKLAGERLLEIIRLKETNADQKKTDKKAEAKPEKG